MEGLTLKILYVNRRVIRPVEGRNDYFEEINGEFDIIFRISVYDSQRSSQSKTALISYTNRLHPHIFHIHWEFRTTSVMFDFSYTVTRFGSGRISVQSLR